MQANQTPVKTTFYASIVLAVIFVIYGLYILVKPRFRKIPTPVPNANQDAPKTPVATENTLPPTPPAASAPQPVAEQTPPQTPATQLIPETYLTRPARLNLQTGAATPAPALSIPTTAPVVPVAPTAPVAPVAPTSNPTQSAPSQWPEIAQIFTDTGYVVKDSPRINSIQTALLAVGLNETLYIGGVNIETTQLQTVIDHLNQVFTDTLEDIYITVNGFVINALDASSPGAPDIMLFDNIDSLRNYMHEHPNPPISDDDAENFDAFSSYISTVLEYLRKM